MKSSSSPIRATIAFGFISGLVALLERFVPGYGGWHVPPPSLFFGVCVGLYGLMMARWARVGLQEILFPLLIALAAALAARSGWASFVAVSLVFSWMRSGICFRGNVFRRLLGEAILCGGAGVGVLMFSGRGAAGHALGIWMFFLVQSLYFLFVENALGHGGPARSGEAFEHARHQAEKILFGA